MSIAAYGAFLGAGAGIALAVPATWGERLSRVLYITITAAIAGAMILGGLSGCMARNDCQPNESRLSGNNTLYGLKGCVPNDLLKELK